MKIQPFSKDSKRERKVIANKFNDLHKRGFNEFDLSRFQKWTKKLRLSLVLKKKNEDHKQ
jgi:hypothetical protein